MLNLDKGLNKTLTEIATIDNIISSKKNLPKRNNCNFPYSRSSIKNCLNLKKCIPNNNNDNLNNHTNSIMIALKTKHYLRKELLNLLEQRKTSSNILLYKKISAVKKQIQTIENIYPTIKGSTFKKGLNLNRYNKTEIRARVKHQLNATKTQLKKKLRAIKSAMTCINKASDKNCKHLNKTLLNLTTVDTKNTFNTQSRANILTQSHFNKNQCLEKSKKIVNTTNDLFIDLAIGTGLTVFTFGAGALLGAGSLIGAGGQALSLAHKSKLAGRMLYGLNITASVPLIRSTVKYCQNILSKLETNKRANTTNSCKALSINSTVTQDLKSCILSASLATLPFALPLGIAKIINKKGTITKIKPKPIDDLPEIKTLYMKKKTIKATEKLHKSRRNGEVSRETFIKESAKITKSNPLLTKEQKASDLARIYAPKNKSQLLKKERIQQLKNQRKEIEKVHNFNFFNKITEQGSSSLKTFKSLGLSISKKEQKIIKKIETKYRWEMEQINALKIKKTNTPAYYIDDYSSGLYQHLLYESKYNPLLKKFYNQIKNTKDTKVIQGLIKNRNDNLLEFRKVTIDNKNLELIQSTINNQINITSPIVE